MCQQWFCLIDIWCELQLIFYVFHQICIKTDCRESTLCLLSRCCRWVSWTFFMFLLRADGSLNIEEILLPTFRNIAKLFASIQGSTIAKGTDLLLGNSTFCKSCDLNRTQKPCFPSFFLLSCSASFCVAPVSLMQRPRWTRCLTSWLLNRTTVRELQPTFLCTLQPDIEHDSPLFAYFIVQLPDRGF